MSLAIVTSHVHHLGLGRRLRRHCLGVGVRLLLGVWDTRSPASRGQQEAAVQEIEARPAKHLALQHLQTIDVPFHGPRTPGQRHACFDRLIVLREPGGEASYGVDGTRSGALQPGFQLCRLSLAHQGREILREVDRLGVWSKNSCGFTCVLCPTAKNGIKSCIFLPSGYDVCTECKSAMHVLFSEFCMDQPHGRQFERPRKRGRPLTYEEKWMVQHVFET